MEYAFVGKNLANEAANLGDNRSLAAETPGRPRLIVNQPRTFGIEVRASFVSEAHRRAARRCARAITHRARLQRLGRA